MRMRLGLAAIVVLVPTFASARPVTLGVGIGRFEAERDWDGEADDTLQLFGRVGVTSRVAGQLEVQKIEGSSDAEIRSATALLVVELGRSGRLVPTMFAGLGVDHAESPWGMTEDGSHIEGGFGLEYVADGGLVLGIDARMGGRSVDNSSDEVILDAGPMIDSVAPMLVESKYRSVRVGVGVRF